LIGIDKGVLIGIDKGVLIGIDKGVLIGIDKGRIEEKKQMAINAKRNGFSTKDIAAITGLTEQEIEAL
ncbi:MAG: hypothetical protein QM528_06395, partial [Phycisphaerales bacterium]|nr:hypothetical protein [Phycisphaerales bacterium]